MATGATDAHVGQELDLQLTRNLTPQIAMAAGYAHIFTGAFLKQATPGASYSQPYVMVSINRLPRRTDRLTPQHHAGFARRTIGLPLVARYACQHTVGPVRHAALSTRHDVVDRELAFPAGCRSTGTRSGRA